MSGVAVLVRDAFVFGTRGGASPPIRTAAQGSTTEHADVMPTRPARMPFVAATELRTRVVAYLALSDVAQPPQAERVVVTAASRAVVRVDVKCRCRAFVADIDIDWLPQSIAIEVSCTT